ncbi:MAG: hypothetical protein NVS4B10_21450 [Myxococcales bacterium]
MRAYLAAAASLALLGASLDAPARIARPLGRTPDPRSKLAAPRIWVDAEESFALERPSGERWSFNAGRKGPGGEDLPLLALSVETGAQVVVQSAGRVPSVRGLTQALAAKLGNEQGLHIEDVERLGARGGEAYGFWFTVASEARGRVAVVKAGDRVALVIASWPLGAPPSVAGDVAGMI